MATAAGDGRREAGQREQEERERAVERELELKWLTVAERIPPPPPASIVWLPGEQGRSERVDVSTVRGEVADRVGKASSATDKSMHRKSVIATGRRFHELDREERVRAVDAIAAGDEACAEHGYSVDNAHTYLVRIAQLEAKRRSGGERVGKWDEDEAKARAHQVRAS